MLQWLLRLGPLSGYADRFGGDTGGNLASLTTAMRAEMDKKKGDEPSSRLQDAFKQLKDMHKDDEPFNFETAQWPYGPVGAPSNAMAASPSVPMPRPRPGGAIAQANMGLASYDPNGSLSEKDANSVFDSFENSPAGKRMRAADMQAPQQSSPIADFFARNTAMMKDPNGGGFVDPQAAAKFGGSPILNGLFG